MLREPFIRSLTTSFPTEDFKFYEEVNRIASLPMPNGHGELLIHDDGDELTFFLGDITHCHFSQEYLGDGKYSPEAEAIEEAIDYLRDLLSDQVVFYRARNGGRDGSIQCPSKEQLSKVLADCNCFVWSKPLKEKHRTSQWWQRRTARLVRFALEALFPPCHTSNVILKNHPCSEW